MSAVAVPACPRSERTPVDDVLLGKWCSFPCSLVRLSQAGNFLSSQEHPLVETEGFAWGFAPDDDPDEYVLFVPIWKMAGGVEVLLVNDRTSCIPLALRLLEESMEDRVLSIDIEWRPDTRPGRNSGVALIQVVKLGILVFPLKCNLKANEKNCNMLLLLSR